MPGSVQEVVGMGVELGPWSLGRPGWRSTPIGAWKGSTTNVAGPADVVLARDGVEVARFHFADEPRPDAAREIAALRRRGFDVYILSGDRRAKVSALAAELGLPASHGVGEHSPLEKAEWLKENGHARMLMLGDGANDSLAFELARCRGTPVIHRGVLERKADFYYLGRGIGGIRALFETNDVRRQTHRTILAFSIVYNLLAVGLAVAGWMNPLVAAILMPSNSLLSLALVTGGMRRAFR